MITHSMLFRVIARLLAIYLPLILVLQPALAASQVIVQETVVVEPLADQTESSPAATPADSSSVESQVMLMFGLYSGTEALLRDAVTKRRAQDGNTTTEAEYQDELNTLLSDPVARWRVAPYILQVGLEALGEPNPSPAQEAFYNDFQTFFSQHQQRASRQILNAWYAHKGYMQDGRTPLLGPPVYGPATISSLWNTGPSVSDFAPPPVKIPMGLKGRAAITTLYGPALFNEDPDFEGMFGSDWESDMEAALAGMGFGVGGLAALGTSMAAYMTLSTVTHTVTNVVAGEVIKKTVTIALAKFGAGSAAGSLVGGLAIAAVVLAAGAMKIADFIKTQQFEDKLVKAASAPSPPADFRAMINIPPPEEQVGLWYEGCNPGFVGELDWCRKPCPADYIDDGVTCRRPEDLIWKDKYYRGQQPLQCAPGLEYDTGLCYPQCQSGYGGVATRCYNDCPDNFRDDGLYCAKPAAYGRGAGYPAWDWDRCEADQGVGNCEWGGAIIYPKCADNYHGVATLCYPDCPAGMADHGITCLKNFYDRGVGRAIDSCAASQEKIGAFCYPLCQSGFEGKLDWCYETGCPDGYRNDPLSCMRDVHIVPQESYYRGVGSVDRPMVEERIETAKAGLLSYLAKAMIGDPADYGRLTLELPADAGISIVESVTTDPLLGSIEGEVLLEGGGGPQNTVVTIVGAPNLLPIATDTAGRFHAPNLPPAWYDLIFEHFGFVSQTVRDVSVTAGDTTDVGSLTLADYAVLCEAVDSDGDADVDGEDLAALLLDQITLPPFTIEDFAAVFGRTPCP